MGYMKMYEVLMDINNDGITDEEKGAAVLKMLNMETHNSITKAMMLNTIDYLFNMVFDVEEV